MGGLEAHHDKKIVVVFAILALAIGFAGSAPSGHSSFRINLLQPAVVNGTDLQPGEYRLNVGDNKITLVQGKKSVEAPAKIETGDSKFESTSIRYVANGGKQVISEIRLGGSKTRILLNP
jgi:hypothetical protein